MPAVTYEITAIVRGDLIAEYEKYMTDRHIPDLMATGAFVSATISRSNPGRYRIRYEAIDRESLDRYLNEQASALREHMSRSFPDGIELSREEWEVVASF